MRFAVGSLSLLFATAAAIPAVPLMPAVELYKPTVCDLMYNGSAEEKKHTWEDSGAKKLLGDFLDSNGVENWSYNFVQKYVKGSKGGSIIDCAVLDSTGCGSALPCKKENYNDLKAFLVAQSMAVFFSQYNQLRENIQDTAISSLAGDIDGVIKIFGPPPNNSNFIITLLIGVFVGGAAMSGPKWQIASPMTAMVSLLNVAASITQMHPPETDQDYEKDLRDSLGNVFTPYVANLKTTIKGVVGGDFKQFPNFKQDPKKYIMDFFDSGKMLDYRAADAATDELMKNTRTLVKQGFVTQALKKQKYYVSMRRDIKKGDCTGEKQVWASDRCNEIVTADKGVDQGGYLSGSTLTFRGLRDDLWKAMTVTYEVDYKTAIENAIDCKAHGTGNLDNISNIPPFGGAKYPRCFFNFDVKDEDAQGNAPGSVNTALQNDNGYAAGSCTVHIRQKQPDNDVQAYKLQATLKDSMGTPLTTVDWQEAKPTAVVQGKESNKKAHLPYNLYLAAGVEEKGLFDNPNVEFWYGDSHWTSASGDQCKFAGKFESNGIRDGDCTFNCPNPTSKPPASATVAHPLPTAMWFERGWCGVHVHQRRYGDNVKSGWYLDVEIKDDKQNTIAKVEKKFVKFGQSIDVQGALPNWLEVITGENDLKKPVNFNYATTKWDSKNSNGRSEGGHECSQGKWDFYHRDMDCGFWCR